MVSIGARAAFVSAQTGDSIKTLEAHYARYQPSADTGRDILERMIAESETLVKPSPRTGVNRGEPETKNPLKDQGVEVGAGDRGRTGDLMLGKHTL